MTVIGQPGAADGHPAKSVEELIWAATLRGDAFVFTATGASGTAGANPTVPAGSFLNIVMKNIGSRRALLFERRFDNNVLNTAQAAAYGGIPSPADIASPAISYGGSNLNDAFGTSSEIVFQAMVSTTRLNNTAGNAVPAATGYLDQSEPLKLMQPRILNPGKSFGQFVVGQAAGLGSINANFTAYVLLF